MLIHQVEKYVEEKFRGQTYERRWGIESKNAHAMRVASLVREMTDDADIIWAAYLHDVLEDTPTTFDEIKDFFGPRVAEYVRILTRNHDIPYFTYIETVGKLRETRILKIADLMDNILHCLEKMPKYSSKLVRYNRALHRLLELEHSQN